MRWLVSYVRDNPGTRQKAAMVAYGVARSSGMLHETIIIAMELGYIEDRSMTSWSKLYITPKGEEFCDGMPAS